MPKTSYTCRLSERTPSRPLVVITGFAGDIGSTLARTRQSKYTVVGLDRASSNALRERIEVDLTFGSSFDRAVNVDGAARLLQALQNLEVEHSFKRAPCWSTSQCSPESVSGSSPRSGRVGPIRARRPTRSRSSRAPHAFLRPCR